MPSHNLLATFFFLFQEAAWETTTNVVDANWPQDGRVEFKDFKVRYREGLDLVLKGINFSVKGGEKVRNKLNIILIFPFCDLVQNNLGLLLFSGWYCWKNWCWKVITHSCIVPHH